MMRAQILLFVGTSLLISENVEGYSRNCGRAEYEKCVHMADPLISDAHMVFPDNMVDIDAVCRKWTVFVDCIRSYIDNCFTEHRRQQFNQAVEVPVDSVHQMCTSSVYQQEYLQHATCLKNTLTDDRVCGRHYRHLAAQAQNTREMDRDDLCCAHNRFRECVLAETRRNCDNKSVGPSKMLPSGFSRQVLDRSLNFLKEQCADYMPNPGECSGYQPNRRDQTADELMGTTRSLGPTYSVSYAGGSSAVAGSNSDMSHSNNPHESNPTDRETEPQSAPTLNPLTWIPSRDGRRRTTEQETPTTPDEPSTRSSYGRGVTWEPTMSRDDLFKATHYKPSTESWYPGNNIKYPKEVEDFNTNILEEPNQQGLAHLNEDNQASSTKVGVISVLLTIVSILIGFFQ